MVKIELKNLDFAYNGSLVLKNINHHFEQGKLISIVGPNGSGKSTILKCMDRILQPKNGTIYLDERNIINFHAEELAKKIAYVPQSEGGTFPATVFDSVLLGRKPHIQWSPRQNDLEVTASMIEKMNLKNISLKSINKLSGGQRQRVFIARALAQEPEVLLLDEPTANLDLKHQIAVLKVLKKLTEQGITVIIAIHDLNLALLFSDHFVLLKDGEVFASGEKEIITNKNIEKLYDIKVNIIKQKDKIFIIPLS
ncbi:MAG: ABC transporter ATP-binding protein [Bacteroidetes bacterium]|nr:ABC transporter ATP-binding protein [Bacteroidota bacterium]